MALNGDARAQAQYDAVAATNPDFSKLSDAEKASLLNSFKVTWGADTTYLVSNNSVGATGTVTTGVGAGGAVTASGAFT